MRSKLGVRERCQVTSSVLAVEGSGPRKAGKTPSGIAGRVASQTLLSVLSVKLPSGSPPESAASVPWMVRVFVAWVSAPVIVMVSVTACTPGINSMVASPTARRGAACATAAPSVSSVSASVPAQVSQPEGLT